MKDVAASLATFLRRSKRTVVLVVVVVAITALVTSLTLVLLDKAEFANFPSTGMIKTVGVRAYSDPDLLNATGEVSWGTVYPGSKNNVTVYLRSISNDDVIFELRSENWTFVNRSRGIVLGPSGSVPYMNLTWNYSDVVVKPGQIIPVALTLSASDSLDFALFIANNDVQRFSVDIVISAVEP